VLPDYQGSGVAEALMEEVEQELRRQGCERLTLDTTAPLERAANFYERVGFAKTGKVSDFFGMPMTEYAKVLR
jgi:GNAT superfamily N-acetyltransferase